jgi:Beta-lactamase
MQQKDLSTRVTRGAVISITVLLGQAFVIALSADTPTRSWHRSGQGTLTRVSAKPMGTSISDDGVQRLLDAEIEAQMREHNWPGVVVSIVVPGEGEYIVVRGKGNLETGRARAIEDPFRVASITKTFTATAILRLIDRGKLRTQKFEDKTILNPALPVGAGAIISTVADLQSYVRVLCKGGLLKPEAQKARLEADPLDGAQPFIKYGEGLALIGRFCGHNGTIMGFSSEMFYLPEQDATIIINVNRLDADDKSQSDSLFAALTKIAFPGYVDW